MSTRATYRVVEVSNLGNWDQCFYIHYDGYPEGAASYFEEFNSKLNDLRDVRWRPGKAICAFGMLSFAEFTKSHESHGDTEYRYNIVVDLDIGTCLVSAFKVSWDSALSETWTKFFRGEIGEFISKYKGVST